MADPGFQDVSGLWAEARGALPAFPRWTRVERLLSVRENAIFEVHGEGRRRGVLRLHRTGYQDARSINSEMLWLQYLSNQGFPVPAPFCAEGDRLVLTTATGRHATLLGWVSGYHPGSAGDPAPIGHRYREIGAALAQLHNATDGFRPPAGFVRPSWDIDGFLGEEPLWGRFWEHSGLTMADARLMQEVREAARADLERFLQDGADFGLIHADPLPDNIFISKSGPVIIDYDDSGYGFRMYDLAVATYRQIDEPGHEGLSECLVAGYREHRELPDGHWETLPLFHLLRSLACLGWVEPRQDFPGSRERLHRYVETARAASMRYLETSRSS